MVRFRNIGSWFLDGERSILIQYLWPYRAVSLQKKSSHNTKIGLKSLSHLQGKFMLPTRHAALAISGKTTIRFPAVPVPALHQHLHVVHKYSMLPQAEGHHTLSTSAKDHKGQTKPSNPAPVVSTAIGQNKEQCGTDLPSENPIFVPPLLWPPVVEQPSQPIDITRGP